MPVTPSLPALRVEGGWRTTEESWTRFAGGLRLRRGDAEATVRVERCAAGRLRETYPVGAHDVEIWVGDDAPADATPDLLRALVRAVRLADPRCRRVVNALAEGDRIAAEAAEAAGFRYVVAVDLPDDQLSLFVYEPTWVTATDPDLDHVPGT
ncbi:hypothetical protein [Sphaerisporangium sp. NPDC051011]|uniref:hypothetical protein n=1 Tax=Sphaerisporangium sp. NPDC051011 TaxID=3155792 RepID=UPI0033F8E0C2